ncbi:hypothetical protein FGIG_11429 [Fasciola gigantica]|uniref:Uncharacterized protein n=1 Tax=Fasciola gigantica TaxID=46835 RepID=A0A504ZDG1_FASGI|nr:hypothetical protein FGIG_11429 [Fasciola gigantica]
MFLRLGIHGIFPYFSRHTQERAHWAGERSALLSRFGSAHRKFSLEEGVSGADTGTNTVGGSTARFFSVSDKLSGQNLANQALESVERMARRVRQKVLSSSLITEDEPDQANLTNDNSEPQALKDKLEMHEKEVLRLRQLLNETPVDSVFLPSTGLSAVSYSPGKIPPLTSAIDADKPLITAIKPDQQGLSDTSGSSDKQPAQPESEKSCPPDDVSSPITEESWIQLQSRMKEIPRQQCSPCVMCANYEQQLQNLQLKQQENEKSLRALGKELSTKAAELNELVQIRDQLESDLKSRSSDHNERMNKLESQFALIQNRVESLLNNYRVGVICLNLLNDLLLDR